MRLELQTKILQSTDNVTTLKTDLRNTHDLQYNVLIRLNISRMQIEY